MSSPAPLKNLDALAGSSFLAIEAATAALPRPSLLDPGATIAVLRERSTTLVVVSGAGGPAGARVDPHAPLTAPELDRLAGAPDGVELLDSIEAGSLPALRVAVEAARQRGLDPSHYRLSLVSEGEKRIVCFADKDAPAAGRGRRGGRPGFEVELAPDLSVRRSSFVR